MSPWANATEAYAFLKSRSRFGIKPGLGRMHALLARLHDPQRDLSFIHVAGTNGKGSTCAMLSALFMGNEEGWKVAQYTSPDLGKLEERISINQVPVAESELIDALFQVHEAMVELPDDPEWEPTEFEVLTAAALVYFAKQQVDLVIWETGLGGRYDATNVVIPEVTVITNVGMDHQEILGDTIAKIAYDKAGIIKLGVPVVTAAQGMAKKVILGEGNQQCSAVYALGKDFRLVRETGSVWNGQLVDYFGIWQDALGLQLPLPGDYQLENAGVALAAYELAKRRLGWWRPQNMQAIQLAKWPGRLELVEKNGVRVIVDGAHNDHAAKALAASLTALRAHSLEIVFGAMADKNIGAVLQELIPLARRIWLTRPDLPRAASLQMLRDKLAALDFPMMDVRMVPIVEEAVREAVMAARTDLTVTDVLVTGSLYTVAEARQYLLH